MKIAITADSKKWMTIDELAAARQMIKDINAGYDSGKNDFENWEVEMLANYVAEQNNDRGVEKIYTATAEISGNSKIHNFYNDNSGRLDVYIRIEFKTFECFYEAGMYLSNIWQLGTPDFKPSYYASVFKRV